VTFTARVATAQGLDERIGIANVHGCELHLWAPMKKPRESIRTRAAAGRDRRGPEHEWIMREMHLRGGAPVERSRLTRKRIIVEYLF
jgi:hypothetical protein